jgi:anthranilate synthase/aminodeoxychorismate synthase-like glutamine amidotransferase
MILLVDNYDSFVFNLERYLKRLGQQTEVVRNDRVDLTSIAEGRYQAIIISPGPKAPDEAGLSLEIIQRFHKHIPILGVCLGHQAICQAMGATIVRAPQAVHGRSSPITFASSRLFEGLPNPFDAARYHSLVAHPNSMPECLQVVGTCPDEHGQPLIMAVEHRSSPLFGVQFHPESILSEVGYRILANFLKIAGAMEQLDLPPTDFASDEVWTRFVKTGNSDSGEVPPVVLPRLHY